MRWSLRSRRWPRPPAGRACGSARSTFPTAPSCSSSPGHGRRRFRVHADSEAARSLPGFAAGGDESHAVAPGQPGRRSRRERGGFLTGVWPKRTEAEDVLANTTIDQVVAQQIGQDTPLPSLEVATEDFTGYVGGCSPGFSCAYMNTISWSTPTTPLPMETNPARGLRAAVRRSRKRGAAPGAHREGAQHSRFGRPRRPATWRAGWVRATARGSPTIWTTSAKSSGASSRPRPAMAPRLPRPMRPSAFQIPSMSTWD